MKIHIEIGQSWIKANRIDVAPPVTVYQTDRCHWMMLSQEIQLVVEYVQRFLSNGEPIQFTIDSAFKNELNWVLANK